MRNEMEDCNNLLSFLCRFFPILLCMYFSSQLCSLSIQFIFFFAIQGSPDLKAAREVANYLQTRHHEFHFTVQVMTVFET